ncbi:MAG: YabP/YqfC family sporulation protein [Ruminococcus flavefaciens]|nr:YabP/YqfC family sporulation protein [Ruminococcus flavefaciens]MCM1229172.1 YabP/YqfC family sporulation protein [Ruminococcus flavefaciens]
MFGKINEKVRETLFLETGLHIAGNKEIAVENCDRIEECSDVFMSLVSKNLLVHIWGSSLRAFDFKTSGLIIRGRISQIELIERSGKYEKPASGKCED